MVNRLRWIVLCDPREPLPVCSSKPLSGIPVNPARSADAQWSVVEALIVFALDKCMFAVCGSVLSNWESTTSR